jgi:hypothetical protein
LCVRAVATADASPNSQAFETDELANFCPKDFAELSVHARAKLRRTQRRKALVVAFWKQAELPI